MTDSVLMVGIATFAEQLPSFLLSPAGGIVADRYNRYKILMLTQIVSAMQAVLLTVVYFSGFGSLWILLALSFFLGVANAFDAPVRQAMVNDLIDDPEDLPGAIAMNASLSNLTLLIGPALAGMVIAKYGAAACFGFNAVSFIAVIVCIGLMSLPEQQTLARWENVRTNFSEGWQYTVRQPEIRNTLLLSILIFLLGLTYNTLQPYFAKDIFEGGASYYGYINAATGLGALMSSLFIASRKGRCYLKKLLLFNLILLGIGLIIMSFVRIFPLYLVMSAVCGFGVMSVMPICNTIIQTATPPQMRGRVLGFFMMTALGALPIGSLLIGWIAKIIPAEICQALQGVLCLLIVVSFHNYFQKENLT